MAGRGATGSTHMLTAIAAVYDAALDENLWPAALAQFTQMTGSQASSFWVLDGNDRSLHPTFVTINFDRRAVDDYVGGLASLDPTVRYLLAHPQEPIVHDGMLPPGDDEDTRTYLDWHVRSVETQYRLVGQARLGTMLQAGIALHRTRKAGRYEQSDIRQFAFMHEHLQRALRFGVRLGSLTSTQQVTTALLDRNVAAVVLLDSQRRVVFMNRSAEQLQSRGDGIRLSAEGIHATHRSEDECLQALVTRAICAQQSGRSIGEVMRVSRLSGRRPYNVCVNAVARAPNALTLFRPAVCVLVSDPEWLIGPPTQHLQSLFKMTPAEARLALRLLTGESLRTAASRLGITYGTARSYLTQLFRKTHTQSQGQLIRLLLSCGLGQGPIT
ncbi:MAG TPA: helix-turn-helix transcriptional regulator [Steroidobacteraceae bacterium]|nr:helix-turn-helix transcriptional regulator [Steroidobacteraceae bacterium]